MDMIEKTGQGLHIIIATETAQDWPTFCCWYSARKSLPDAKITVVVNRTTRIEFQYYQWLKRLQVPHRFQNPIYRNQNLHKLQVACTAWDESAKATLVVSPHVAFLSQWNEQLAGHIESLGSNFLHDDYSLLAGYREKAEIMAVIDQIFLEGAEIGATSSICPEAKETVDAWPLVGYFKGCGKWINTMTDCPFTGASGIVGADMSVNEWKIIEMWRRMVPLYSAVQ